MVGVKKVKDYLNDLGIAFDYIYVDLTTGDERDEVVNEVKKYNDNLSFPTLVINKNEVLIGFKENEMKELLS